MREEDVPRYITLAPKPGTLVTHCGPALSRPTMRVVFGLPLLLLAGEFTSSTKETCRFSETIQIGEMKRRNGKSGCETWTHSDSVKAPERS